MSLSGGAAGRTEGGREAGRGYSEQAASEAGERGSLSPSDLESPSSRRHRVCWAPRQAVGGAPAGTPHSQVLR